MSERAPYSRVYWTVMDDPKFDGIRENPKHFGAWCLLLIVADMAHPAPAFPPPTVPKASMNVLVEAGLVDPLSGGRFRIHGLDAERGRRSDAGRVGGLVSGRSRTVERTGNERSPDPRTKSNLDETRQDKPSNRAPAREGPKDPLREAQRAAYIELYGNGNDAPVNLSKMVTRTPVEQERETHRLEALALHERFLRNDLTDEQYQRLLADIGKEQDDLTRTEA